MTSTPDDLGNAIALAALDELAKARAALIAALGGDDAVPPETTTLQLVDALVQMKTHYYRGFGACHARHRAAEQKLREHGIDWAYRPEGSGQVRGPLSRANWGNIDPPAIRWVPDGERAGFYAWIPGIERWQWTSVRGGGVANIVVRALPEGTSEQLFCWADVRLMLNEYRDVRAATLTDISDQRHGEILDEIWLLMSDASDWPMIAADNRYERERAGDA